ncbi:MAG: hypothetical protein QM775_30725 [Pirellulales bacterium]
MVLLSYYHAEPIAGDRGLSVTCCMKHPDLFQHYATQVARVDEQLKPHGWLLGHDEIRVAGRCSLCDVEGKTCGDLLSDNVGKCLEIARGSGSRPVAVWSDMFDKYHNARENYFLAHDTFAESWNGLKPVGETRIINWNNLLEESDGPNSKTLREKSVEKFQQLGHKQTAAMFYDKKGDLEEHTKSWLDLAGKYPSIDAFLYTTWENDFSKLKWTAEQVRARFPN